MAKVALFANGAVGIEVAKYLIDNGDEIVKLYLHEPAKQLCVPEIITNSQVKNKDVVTWDKAYSEDTIQALNDAKPDFIITIYWAYLLKPILLNIAKIGTINFHPSLLPINRGWYPHVHSFLDGTPFGVTLHSMDAGADTGPIWVQKQVIPDETDNASDIYKRLEREIFDMFKTHWEDIKDGKLQLTPQDHSKAIYRKKEEVDKFDCIDLDKPCTAKELLNILKARTFGNRGFAYYKDENGEKVYVHIKLGRTNNFIN